MTENIQKIVNEYTDNNAVYIDREGQHVVKMSDLLATGADNVLKSVNRTEQILLTLAERNPQSLKWVNDYAVARIVKELFSQIDTLRANETMQQTEIEKLRLQIEELSQSTAQVETEDMGATIDKLTVQNGELITTVDELKDTVAGLQNDLDNSTAKLRISMSAEKSANIKIAELENAINDYRSNLETAQSQVPTLTNELENVKAENVELRTQIEKSALTSKDEVDELKLKLADYTERAKKVINEKIAEIESYKHAADENEIEFQKLVSESSAAKMQVTELQQKSDALTNQLQIVENDLAEADNKYNKLATAYDTLKSSVDNLTKERDNYHLAYDKSREQAEQIAIEASENEEYRNKAQKMFEDIQEALNNSGFMRITSLTTNTKKSTQSRMGGNQEVDFNLGM